MTRCRFTLLQTAILAGLRGLVVREMSGKAILKEYVSWILK